MSTVSAWAPLRDPRFRIAWAAFLGAQVVIWAQTVGAVEVITERSDSATLVALIQTAVSAPGVALSLLAGAVADVVDRRRLLIGATLAMTVTMAGLAVLTGAGAATPVVVLVLTAALGAGLAMFMPAFSATVPELVPRALLPPAVAITNASVNIARAAGPALAGGLLAAAGAGGLFWGLAGVLAAVTFMLVAAGPRPSVPERPERIAAAMRAGARYARFSSPLRTVILRTALFVTLGSALWALLPLVAVRRLGLDGSGFGLLLGCVGTGAVAGVAFLPRVQARLAPEALVAGATVVLAVVLALLTVVAQPVVAAAILLVAGVVWITALTVVINAALATAAAWVRGRAMATWLLAYQLGLALGSLLWGLVADASLDAALLIPAAALVLSVPVGRIAAIPADADVELEPARSWADPVIARDVHDDDGPVLVIVEYEVDEAVADRFVAAMTELSVVRRRDGATRWDLFHDLEDPRRYVETFTSTTWGEHLRQHERGTQVDLPLEERAAQLAKTYTVRHLVSPVGRSR